MNAHVTHPPKGFECRIRSFPIELICIGVCLQHTNQQSRTEIFCISSTCIRRMTDDATRYFFSSAPQYFLIATASRTNRFQSFTQCWFHSAKPLIYFIRQSIIDKQGKKHNQSIQYFIARTYRMLIFPFTIRTEETKYKGRNKRRRRRRWRRRKRRRKEEKKK